MAQPVLAVAAVNRTGSVESAVSSDSRPERLPWALGTPAPPLTGCWAVGFRSSFPSAGEAVGYLLRDGRGRPARARGSGPHSCSPSARASA